MNDEETTTPDAEQAPPEVAPPPKATTQDQAVLRPKFEWVTESMPPVGETRSDDD